LAVLLPALVSCYPGEVTSLEELDLVVTFHDDTVTFTNFQTYFVPDSVVHLDLSDPTNDDLLDRANDALILTSVRSNLEALGYVEAADENTTPDVVVLVAATAQQNIDVYVSYPWYSYWGWYGGWGCCGTGWGYYYPYPVVTDVVAYKTGTLVISMFDPNNLRDTEQEVPGLWVAAANGLLEGTAADITIRISRAIDQAFGQSPYLRTN
jgi:hypothetical protein